MSDGHHSRYAAGRLDGEVGEFAQFGAHRSGNPRPPLARRWPVRSLMILRTGALIAAQAGPLDTVERLLTDAFDRGLTHGMGLHADPFPRPLRQRPSFKRMIRPIGQR